MNSCQALRRWIGLSFLLFVLSASSAFPANRQQVNYDITLGVSGLVPEQSVICPVTITIDNQVGSTRGQIKITQPISGSSEVTHFVPFETPAPSIKQFTIPVRLERGRDMTVTVLFDDFIKPIQKSLKIQRSDKPLVLCLGIPPLLKVSKASEKYRFVNVAAQALPNDPIALDEAHAVMISGLALASLDKDRISALHAWTAAGGRTMLAGCPPDEAFRVNFKRLAGSASVDPAKKGVSFVGAGVLACSGPLQGTQAAFWDGRPDITKALFPAMHEKDEDIFSHLGNGGGHFSNLWRTKRTYGFLAFLSIIIIVGTYVLVIGPVDWWLVRRFKKPYLTWIIFACAIALFSFLAYSYSTLVNVGAMRAVQVNVLDTSQDSSVAKGNTQLWVYSAKNTTYLMDTPLSDVVFSARESALGAGSVAGVTVQNGINSRITARIPIFSSKQFDATWYADWKKPVTVSKKDGRAAVSFPEDIKPRHVYLADEQGLTEMNESEGLWVAEPYQTRWKDCISSYAQSLGSPHNVFASSSGELLPDEEKLRHYLICMSFPWQIKMDPNDWHQTSMYRQTRDAREAAMDIRYRLHNGRVLLVFLDNREPLLPIHFQRHKPKTVHMDLVRLQIPEKF